MAMNGVGCRGQPPRIIGVGLNTILRRLKTQAAVGNLARMPLKVMWIVCAEMDEQWGYVGKQSSHVSAGCFYAYDGIRRTIVAHVFGERLWPHWGVFLSLLVALRSWWMTDGLAAV